LEETHVPEENMKLIIIIIIIIITIIITITIIIIIIIIIICKQEGEIICTDLNHHLF
jgi:lipopolysaccharide/colanic/teichoic acid biosynthesis glycosyltransferase